MKREEAIKLVEQGFEELEQALKAGHSDALLRYLKVMSQFHSYSLRNALLICMQKPDSTRVAGFHAWKKLDRTVKKGEKGIAIFAPMVFRKKEERQEKESDGEERSLHGFKVVHVFDVSQTEGEPLPEFETVNGAAGENLARMKQVIASCDIQLQFDSLEDGVKGMSKGGKIVVEADLPDNEKFSVAAHELAHERLHHGERKGKVSKKVRETEAEAVAFIVCHAFGIDSTNHSSDYIQLYDGTTETLTESLTFIQSTAEWMIDAINIATLDCDHTTILRNGHGGLNGSWVKDDSVRPAKFTCGVCGKFYGYAENKLAVSREAV